MSGKTSIISILDLRAINILQFDFNLLNNSTPRTTGFARILVFLFLILYYFDAKKNSLNLKILMCIICFLIFKPKVNLKKNFKLQIIRSLLMVTATTFMFYSLHKFDLVDIYVVFFSAPLIVSLLSAYFLKDILSFKGILLMLLSFGSIIYSLGPSMKIFSLDLIFPLVPPICWALYQFFTKVVSSDNEPFASIFYTSILGAIIFSIFISFNWVPLEKNIYWLYLVVLGVAGFVSHSLIIYAIQLSNLSFVTNFQYSQLIWSTIVNFLIFGVPFDYNKIIGVIGIIIFGLLFIRTEGNKDNVKA